MSCRCGTETANVLGGERPPCTDEGSDGKCRVSSPPALEWSLLLKKSVIPASAVLNGEHHFLALPCKSSRGTVPNMQCPLAKHLHNLVLSVVRKTDAAMLPALLLAVGVPSELLNTIENAEALASAAYSAHSGQDRGLCHWCVALHKQRTSAEAVAWLTQSQDIVVSVARKTDAAMWPALFLAVGVPSELLNNLVDAGALASAACCLLIVDRIEGSAIAHSSALRLIRVSAPFLLK